MRNTQEKNRFVYQSSCPAQGTWLPSPVTFHLFAALGVRARVGHLSVFMEKALLPPEYSNLLQELAPTPGPSRAMWYYVLVLLMVEDDDAEIIESNSDGDVAHLVVRTPDGDEFDVVRPPMSQELVNSFLGYARERV